MPYITSIERIAKQEGRQEGRQEGLREGILSGIKLALTLKFGESGLSLMPEIEAIASIEILQDIQAQMVTLQSKEEVQQIYRD